jgi:hypothetical protein
MQFIDAYSFDVRSVKKTCVHIVHPDGRLIPFDTDNLFYRDGLEQSRLAPLRRWAERLGIDHAVSASQEVDQKKAEKTRGDVIKALRGMHRGTTATVERKDGTRFDVVIEEITADTVTVLRQIGDKAGSETLLISDIARIKKTSAFPPRMRRLPMLSSIRVD